MSKVIAVANQKGGVAKTTTVINLGAALANMGYRVLLVDNDPQATLTVCNGIEQPDELPMTLVDLYEVLIREGRKLSIEECILHSGNVDVLPTDIGMSSTEANMITAMKREELLKIILSDVQEKYDYILIDCPPNLLMMSLNALTACDSVIIPVFLDYVSTKGLELLLQSIAKAKQFLNPQIKIDGIIFTKYEKTNESQKTEIAMREIYGNHIKIFDTRIPKRTKVAESLGNSKDIMSYDSKSAAAIAYTAFAKEVATL